MTTQQQTHAVTEREPTLLERALLPRYAANFRQGIVRILGTEERADALIVEVLNLARKTPDLHLCSVESLRFAVTRMASMGLNPGVPNEVWLVPFNNKKEEKKGNKVVREYWAKEVELIYGYGGLRKLVLRSPEVVHVFAERVCVQDRYEPARSPIELPLHQLPGFATPRGPTIGYYAAAQLRSGHWVVVAMSKADVAGHRDRYSRAAQSKFWSDATTLTKGNATIDLAGQTPFDAMAMKTCLRALCSPRKLNLEPEVVAALLAEETLFQRPAAMEQGYSREGQFTRPAVPMHATGMALDELLQDVGGTTDHAEVEEALVAARTGKPREKAQAKREPEASAGVNPITGEVLDDARSLFDADASAAMDRELVTD